MTVKEAKEACIVHWEEIRDAEFEEIETDSRRYKPDSNNCAFCQLFAIKNGHCSGCPIEKVTSLHGCKDTPFCDAVDAYNDYLASPSDINKKAKYDACQAEIDFLKSVPVEE